MGKYTSLARKVEEATPQKGGDAPVGDILSVNIVNIHGNRDSSISKPTSDRPEHTLKGYLSVESSQGVASGSEDTERAADKRPTTLRPTTLTTLFGDDGCRDEGEEVWTAVAPDPRRYTRLIRGSASTRCIHDMTPSKCAVCGGYVRRLLEDEARLRAAQANPEKARRAFWARRRLARDLDPVSLTS